MGGPPLLRAPLRALLLALLLAAVLCLGPGRAALLSNSSLLDDPEPNAVTEVRALRCGPDALRVRVLLRRAFRGLLFARGFPGECRAQGAGRSALDLALPAGACGVRLESQPDSQGGGLRLRATLELQLDARLRQARDSAIEVTCRVPTEDLARDLAPGPAPQPVPAAALAPGAHREARARGGLSGGGAAAAAGSGAGGAGGAGERRRGRRRRAWAWMELRGPAPGGRSVAVGEPLEMRIRAHAPEGVGVRAVACVASDGAGESTQRLLDEEGCPEGPAGAPPLLPPPRPPPSAGNDDDEGGEGGEGPEGARPLHELRSRFPAFKFPERSALHVRCELQLCRGRCPQAPCADAPGARRHAQRATKGEPGEVLQTLEVFNSVEVLAPGIELDPRPALLQPGRPRARADPRPSSGTGTGAGAGSGPGTGERALCLPAARLALAFGLLGLLFLAALGVAAYSLLRARRRAAARPPSAWSGSWDAASAHRLLLLAEEPARLGPPRPHWAAGR